MLSVEDDFAESVAVKSKYAMPAVGFRAFIDRHTDNGTDHFLAYPHFPGKNFRFPIFLRQKSI